MGNATAERQVETKKSFRDKSSFGTRMEYWIIGEMLRQGLDVYRPLVDDMGIDAIIRRKDGSFLEVQIKAISDDAIPSTAAFFANIKCEQSGNYWFIFYSSQIGEKGTIWLLSVDEFKEFATRINKDTSKVTWDINFGGIKTNKETGHKEPYANPKYEKYICQDFSFSRLEVGEGLQLEK